MVNEEGASDPLASDSLDPLTFQVLEQVENVPKTLRELSVATGATASTVGAVVSCLGRLGYLRDKGIWTRRMSLSDKGKEVLGDYRLSRLDEDGRVQSQ